MRTIHASMSLSSFAVAVGLICSVAQAQTYRVASFSDGYGPLTAVINNSGVVAFYGERMDTSGERFHGIYKGKNAVTTLMEDSIDLPPATGTYQLLPPGNQHVLSLNTGGKVGFYGWKGGASTVVAYVGAGPVARANFAFDTGKGLGTGVGGTAITITDDGYLAYDTIVRSPTPGILYSAAPAFPIGPLNNAHQFIRFTEPATNYVRIELGLRSPVPNFPELAPIRTNLLKGIPIGARFAMNDRGTVAFSRAQISGNVGTFGIYKWSGGSISTVVETIQDLTTGAVSTEFTIGDGSGHMPFAINNNDEVVFYGKSKTLNRAGFFRGSNPLTGKIVAIGDVVDGLQMNYMRAGEDQSGLFNKKWFNDAGQIVFVGADINNAGGLFVTSGVASPPDAVSSVYRWNPPVSPPNGSFGITNNWQSPDGEAPRVPQKTNTLNDTALFDLPETYAVQLGFQHAARLIVKDGNVTFTNGSILVDATSFDNPSVVIDNARLTLSFDPFLTPLSPMLTCNHALIGKLASRVDVINNARWLLHGSLRVGGFGEGILTIASLGEVISGEGRIGGAGGGHVNVSEAGLWDTGDLAIGIDGGGGDLTIQDGGKVHSASAVIGNEAGTGNNVIVQGNLDEAISTWSVTEYLAVGGNGVGHLEVRDGGSVTTELLKVGNTSHIFGQAIVNGAGTNSMPSEISAEILSVGTAGIGDLRIEQGGLVEVSGEQIYLGSRQGRAIVTVDGVASGTGDPSTLRLTNPDAALSLGDESVGVLIVRNGGLVEMSSQSLTFVASGLPTEPSEIRVEGSAAKLTTGALFVGTTGNEQAFVTLVDGTVDASSAIIGAHGVIRGVGTLAVDPAQRLINGGIISPGLSPGVLTIQGSYEQRFDGNLLIEIGGTNSGAHDQFVVTGDAELDGNVTFRCINGFAPKTGDRIDFFNAPTVNGAFVTFGLQNLAPGFQFDVSTNGSLMTMTALNDAKFDANLPGQVSVTVTNIGGISYAVCTIRTLNVCDSIVLDGALTQTNTTFAQSFQGTRFVGGDCFAQDVTTTNILVLGALPPGNYSFNVISAGQTIATVPFTASSSIADTLLSPTRAGDGSLQFQLDGPASVPCAIEASSDLLNWTELDTQTFPATFTDFDAAIFPQRFYRARIRP